MSMYGRMHEEARKLAARVVQTEVFTLMAEPMQRNLIRFAHWLMRMVNKAREKNPWLVYYMPTLYVEIAFDVFFALKRSGLVREIEKELDELAAQLIAFISRHFNDPMIAHPDLKEQNMRRLN